MVTDISIECTNSTCTCTVHVIIHVVCYTCVSFDVSVNKVVP